MNRKKPPEGGFFQPVTSHAFSGSFLYIGVSGSVQQVINTYIIII